MSAAPKRRSFAVVNACMASVVLYYVLDLSSSGRTWVDFAVITLVVGAILWNLVQLGRKLHGQDGAAAVWHVQRTVLFWLIGLFNTALIRPGDVGSWKNWLGWALIIVAVVDTVALFLRERAVDKTINPA
jgi:FtsH-binding integral membrane protein